MYRITAIIILLVICGFAGCQSTAMPSLKHPGTMQEQQNRAVRFDPYPEKEPGPALTGVRPKEYENPLPETYRARWHLGNQTQ
jgi:hypothetical protein